MERTMSELEHPETHEQPESGQLDEGSAKRQQQAILSDSLRHPLVLLLVGSLLTALVIPYINARSNRANLIREARLKKAIEIINRSSEFNSQLNSLGTALGVFHFDNVRAKTPLPECREAQKTLNMDMNARYLEFEKRSWWWYGDLLQEAVVLELASPTDLQRLGTDVNEYGANVGQSVGTLSDLWHALVSPDYDPNDKKISKLIDDTNQKLADLFESRRKLTERLVQHFTTEQ
jgi:hypothetical protein